MSWALTFALAALVVTALMVVAHTVSFYAQILAFALVAALVVGLLARKSWRRVSTAVRRRDQPPPPAR